MPIYEYECQGCGFISGHLVMKPSDRRKLTCRQCESKKLRKVMSRFAAHKTESQRLDEFTPSDARGDSFYKDDRNIGLWAQKRAQQMGLDLGESFGETLEKGRSRKILDNL
ncbi:MAG: zinc ribbon domain-containing protein [Nitrospinaceae bacterium]|nr:zinc ribbon domain-containing protein [Nitrospinaceae bacterium]